MTKIFGLCPRCKSRIKINNIERIDGKTIHCRDCGRAIRIRAPRPVLVGEKSEETVVDLGDDALDDSDLERPIGGDEFVGDVELPEYRPLTRRPRSAQKTVKKAESEDDGTFLSRNQDAKKRARKGKHSPLVVGLVFGACALVTGLLVGGFFVLRSSDFGTPAKFVRPEKYVAMKPSLQPVTGVIPEGWTEMWNGGRNGIPISARIYDGGGSISIDLRETEGSSAKGKMKKALVSGQEVHQIGGPTMAQLDEAPAIGETHEYNRHMVMKDFLKYNEGPGRPIQTQGFGEALISDFSGREGYFSGAIVGCRASIAHRDHQYSIVCKCPPSQLQDVEPVFEKIIGSLGTWE